MMTAHLAGFGEQFLLRGFSLSDALVAMYQFPSFGDFTIVRPSSVLNGSENESGLHGGSKNSDYFSHQNKSPCHLKPTTPKKARAPNLCHKDTQTLHGGNQVGLDSLSGGG